MDLTFTGITDDGAFLLLTDDQGNAFRVAVDEHLVASLRRDRRPGQLSIPMNAEPSPKEIQQRIREGDSVEDLAAATGMAYERVERFAAPVLAERTYICDLARETLVRRPDGALPLEGLVLERLGLRGAARRDLRWDAWRDGNHAWTVLVGYPMSHGDRVATWAFTPESRMLRPADDEARWIMEEPAARQSAGASGGSAAPTPAAEQAAAAAEDDDPLPADASAGMIATDRPATVEVVEVVEIDQAAEVVEVDVTDAVVPTWDEILFGPRPTS